MWDIVDKYKINDHFFFKASDNLEEVCNAPSNKAGVYVIYALKGGRIELIYIGCTGEVRPDGTIFISTAGLGSLKDHLVNGVQFGARRLASWKAQLLKEKIEAIDVYWFVTHNTRFVDRPKVVENELLQWHYDVYGKLPRWNGKM